MAARNRLHRHETDIVTVASVTGAGIPETDKKQHGVNGVGLQSAHDLFRKPVPVPDRGRGHAFPITQTLTTRLEQILTSSRA
jgi:hypothetical protein